MAGIGDALRSARERRNLSIDEVARETRISPRFLEALEAEQFDELPAPVYVRGFLRSYASFLKLEPQPLLDRLVGGDASTPSPSGGYVGRDSRHDTPSGRRNDPFQRSGVVPAPAIPGRPQMPRGPEPEDDGWSPEPLPPFTAPHEDHGYVPGSDLMEAPEYGYSREETRFHRRTSGVLAERPPPLNEPAVSRVALVGGAVVGVLMLLGVAVLLTRGDGGGNNPALSPGETPEVTPGTVISLGSRTNTPAASASAVASAAPDATVAAEATPTPQATTEGSATPAEPATPAQTPTRAPTAAPTATPVPDPPTATPTSPPPVVAESNGFGECTAVGTSYDCGAPPYRVICYAPLGGQSWWVDANRSFGTLPDGWRAADGLQDNGDIITAGTSACAP